MVDTTPIKNAPHEESKNGCNNKKEYEMTTIANTETFVNVERTTEAGEKIKPGLILRSFKGYNGKGYVFEVLTDPETGDHYIVDPKMKGGPKGVSSYNMISLFKDQFGKPQFIFFPEYTLEQKSVTGETGAELLDRATREWMTIPKKGDGPIPKKFDLPEPIPFDFSYSTFLDIIFGDKIIDSIDHPLMKKLMAKESYNTKD